MRMLVLLLAAIGTLIEAVAFGGLLYVMGDIIGTYAMSMGGLPADTGRLAIWISAAVIGFGLFLLAMSLVVAAVRGKPFGRPTRVGIIVALVWQAILGIVMLLTAGPLAVLGVLFVFACLLLAVVNEPAPHRVPARSTV
jgi:hypothetical protein